MKSTLKRILVVAAALVVLSAAPARLPADDDAAGGAPTVSLDKNPKIVAYQLKKLTNAQLLAVDRKTDAPKYRPVYEAILTRKGIEKKFREESVEAIATIDKSDPVTVILAAIPKVEADDKNTPRELASLLVAQKPGALAAQKETLTSLAKESENATVKQAAYAALVTADGNADAAWKMAADGDGGGTKALLSAVPMIASAKVRGTLYDKVRELAQRAPDDATQAAALEALGSIPGHEADAFALLATAVGKETGEKQAAAVRAVGRIPASKWPKDQVEPLAKQVVSLVERTPATDRTNAATVQAVQLGNDLAGALAPEQGAPIRKALRGLAVRVVVMHTLTEQMMYDLHYFTVQAGKPVQIILDNTDNMPHNVVITTPGAMQEVAITAGSMSPPDDPKAKAFVPESPKVLQSTILVQPGESETLSFTAPAKPGNYNFLCTYPGHWVKMYGVMQVVADLDQYDQKPVAPKDPLTHKPYASPKNEGVEGGEAMNHEHAH